ncbi:hypothetical protein [Aquiflexum sp.]|uniref:hypothetical protein n=1 Tax=Aquiflexum sp. TaxID=1872584 RepID=UPI0035946A55
MIRKHFLSLFRSILLGLVIISCGERDKNNALLGNWYGFEQDSTYYELYINDTLIVLNHENIGPIGYDYHVQENILIVSNAAGMERIWQITEIEKELFTIKDSLETITYFKIDIPLDFFESIKDSISYVEFKERFSLRYLDKKADEVP